MTDSDRPAWAAEGTTDEEADRMGPEWHALLTAGATRAQIEAWTDVVVEWAAGVVAATPRQTHAESHALRYAIDRLRTEKRA